MKPLFTWRTAVCSETSGLTSGERLVALVLSLHMSELGDSCFPKLDTLSREAAMSYDGIRRIVRRLVETGWLTRDFQRKGSGRGTRVEYTATIPPTTGTPDPGEVIHKELGNTGTQDPGEVIHRDPGSSTTGIVDPVPPGSPIPVSNSPRTLQELPATPPWQTAGMSRADWLDSLSDTQRWRYCHGQSDDA